MNLSFQRLHLPLMVSDSADPRRTAYTVSVDAAAGVTTGISAADRTRTLHALAQAAQALGLPPLPAHLTSLGDALCYWIRCWSALYNRAL